jgi:hypothetical protein
MYKNLWGIYFILSPQQVDRDSSVGTAIRYGLDGPEFESRWGAIFSAPVQTGPGAYPASYTMGTGSLLGVKGRSAVLNTHPDLAPRLRKSRAIPALPPLGLRGLLQGDLCLCLYLQNVILL